MIRSSSRKGYTSPWPPQALDDTQPEGMTGMDIEIILDPNLTPEQVAEIAMAAEKGGVRTLWHGNMHSTWDAFVALVPAAMATSKIRLGTLAISPYEMHPLKIANAILSLNEIAKGRAIVAIGGGGAVMSATSKDGVRLDFRKMRVVRGVREAVEIVKAASSGKLMKGYDGELFSITMPSRRDWLKSEPPKVYTCSDGPQMTRMGARVADGMMFGDLTIHRAAEVMANIEAGAAKRAQPADDFRIGNYWAWHIKKDRERSMYEARRSLVWRTQLVPPFHGLDLLLEEDEAQLVRDNFDNFAKAYYTRSGEIDGVPQELVDYLVGAVSSAGDYDDIDRELERYRELEKAGFTDLALKIFDDPMDNVQTICERVIPNVA
jgi:alkanesulfonate monooxygenase SsuD/methylene tetrahydromethanopterin reductase-like flavin-dependent oxidoreductase (luciferase family)